MTLEIGGQSVSTIFVVLHSYQY